MGKNKNSKKKRRDTWGSIQLRLKIIGKWSLRLVANLIELSGKTTPTSSWRSGWEFQLKLTKKK